MPMWADQQELIYISSVRIELLCNWDDLPRVIDDGTGGRESVWEIRVVSMTWWWSWCYIYRHHHIALVARISLTLSHHSSLSFITLGRSSGQHPVSSHSCWMYVRAGRPAFARPCVGVHKSTSLMSSFLLLQQCPACLVRLTWIVCVIGGRWPYSWCLVGCCRQDLFNIYIYIYIYIYISNIPQSNSSTILYLPSHQTLQVKWARHAEKC